MIGKLSTIMVVVKDMKRSVQFYRDVLGLRLGMESPQWSQFDLGNVTLGLHPEGKEAKVAPTTGCTFGFEVQDLGMVLDNLRWQNVKVVMEPRDEGFGKLAIVADPDGYLVQLFQPAKQATPAA
ncbi:MAG: VOC family protein [Acidobacteriota bacterium]|nr:VOC family protein [Acidobacteriota bacterium]